MNVTKTRPAETATATIGAAAAAALGADGNTAGAIGVILVAITPTIVTAIREHGVRGALRRLWFGRAGG